MNMNARLKFAGVGLSATLLFSGLAACSGDGVSGDNDSSAPISESSPEEPWLDATILGYDIMRNLGKTGVCYTVDLHNMYGDIVAVCDKKPEEKDEHNRDPFKAATRVVSLSLCYRDDGATKLMLVEKPANGKTWTEAEERHVDELHDKFESSYVTDPNSMASDTPCVINFYATEEFASYHEPGTSLYPAHDLSDFL